MKKKNNNQGSPSVVSHSGLDAQTRGWAGLPCFDREGGAVSPAKGDGG